MGTTAIVGGGADAGEKENRRAVIRLLFIEHYANRGTRCVYTVCDTRRRVSGENPASFTNERSERAQTRGRENHRQERKYPQWIYCARVWCYNVILLS